MAERDNHGRFVKGHAGGPGRPRRNVEADFLLALREGVTMTHWRAVVHRAVLDAVNGDGKAREWLSRYLLPAPEVIKPPSETEKLFGQLLGFPEREDA